MIETTISNNIDLLLGVTENHSKAIQKKNQGEGEEQDKVKKIHLRKYFLDGRLYESVIVNKSPKFLAISTIENSTNNDNNNDACSNGKSDDNNIQIKLVDRIEVPNYTFYPATLLTHNPIPYSFETEDELKKYIELAKKKHLIHCLKRF